MHKTVNPSSSMERVTAKETCHSSWLPLTLACGLKEKGAHFIECYRLKLLLLQILTDIWQKGVVRRNSGSSERFSTLNFLRTLVTGTSRLPIYISWEGGLWIWIPLQSTNHLQCSCKYQPYKWSGKGQLGSITWCAYLHGGPAGLNSATFSLWLY